MENFGVVSELNWNFPDESEFTLAQLLGSFSEMHEQDQETSLGINSMFWSEFDQGASSYNTFENIPSCWPSSSNTASASSYFFSPTECESYELNTPNTNYNPVNYQIEGFICLKDDQNEVKENSINNPSDGDALPDHKAKRKFPEHCVEDKDDGIPSESPKKKARGSSQVLNKSTRSKKGQNNGGNSEETLSNASSSSEDELNASQELNEGSISKGKGRAGRGSATDPQSLYARKRRERINERLRILQNLVPNGTKVDISTMLDEAVQYVKFLQLQIKLLSSDDLWMYAPLAYNGMDIGLDLKLSFPKP